MPPRTPPRKRPADAAPDVHDLSATSRAFDLPGSAADEDGADPSPSADAPTGGVPAWREQLARLTASGALTDAQEAACERLIRSHEDEVRARLPALLNQLKPHFGTLGEAEAKQAFTRALEDIKVRQQDELRRLLASLGVGEAASPGG